jgi:hypothetical protein
VGAPFEGGSAIVSLGRRCLRIHLKRYDTLHAIRPGMETIGGDRNTSACSCKLSPSFDGVQGSPGGLALSGGREALHCVVRQVSAPLERPLSEPLGRLLGRRKQGYQRRVDPDAEQDLNIPSADILGVDL